MFKQNVNSNRRKSIKFYTSFFRETVSQTCPLILYPPKPNENKAKEDGKMERFACISHFLFFIFHISFAQAFIWPLHLFFLQWNARNKTSRQSGQFPSTVICLHSVVRFRYVCKIFMCILHVAYIGEVWMGSTCVHSFKSIKSF